MMQETRLSHSEFFFEFNIPLIILVDEKILPVKIIFDSYAHHVTKSKCGNGITYHS